MSNLNKQNKKNACLIKPWRSRGFTLIEMLIAVSIFSMSILAFMTVLSNGISDTNYAKNKTVAAFLAVEGVEYARNLRDSFVNYDTTADIGWQNFKTIVSSCAGPLGCNLGDVSSYDITEIPPIALSTCNVGNNCLLYFYPNTGKYSYDHSSPGGSSSGFTRVITIDPVGDEVKISSTVSWFNGSVPFSITFSDNLLKWKE